MLGVAAFGDSVGFAGFLGQDLGSAEGAGSDVGVKKADKRLPLIILCQPQQRGLGSFAHVGAVEDFIDILAKFSPLCTFCRLQRITHTRCSMQAYVN